MRPCQLLHVNEVDHTHFVIWYFHPHHRPSHTCLLASLEHPLMAPTHPRPSKRAVIAWSVDVRILITGSRTVSVQIKKRGKEQGDCLQLRFLEEHTSRSVRDLSFYLLVVAEGSPSMGDSVHRGGTACRLLGERETSPSKNKNEPTSARMLRQVSIVQKRSWSGSSTRSGQPVRTGVT